MKFIIRDLLWLTVVAALAVSLGVEWFAFRSEKMELGKKFQGIVERERQGLQREIRMELKNQELQKASLRAELDRARSELEPAISEMTLAKWQVESIVELCAGRGVEVTYKDYNVWVRDDYTGVGINGVAASGSTITLLKERQRAKLRAN